MKGATVRRAPRYTAVSLFCVLFNNFLLIALDEVGIHYAVAVVISAGIMIPLAYALHSAVTFGAEPGWRAFARYFWVQIVNTPIAWLLFLLIHDWGDFPMLFAAPLVTGLLFLWNYFSSGWAIVPHTATRSSL